MDTCPDYARHVIGRYSYGRPKLEFQSSGARLTVGQFCSFADEVRIFLGGEHRTDWVTTYPFPVMIPEARDFSGHPATRGDVVVGSDVWVGHGACILSGIRIGDGAVIGAQAVVSRSVEPYAVVAGNPARQVRLRFSERQVAALLRIRWWDWPYDRIVAELPWLLSPEIDAFIARHPPSEPVGGTPD
ncbi:MAG: antibiotic acetyltransferase [Lysobacterales bacterium]|nr:MAG: antibiotic acetyltransferase [Xanthomonadales bacterium]